ncbi:MAG: B12-binding domain-containing radical SAM protein [Armatimonadetes bacterium]|nr:B12-binding domain-containing radical SAM protein [Armatimonadota bacterium]
MLNVCLISPNYALRDEFGSPADPPLGIALIASVLKKNYNLKIIDANALNLNFKDILKKLNEFKAQIIGISCNYSPLHNAAINLAEFIKKNYSPQVKIIAGGNHASALAEYLLKSSQGSIDYIAMGEGEEILPKLLNALENNLDLSNLKGLLYYKDNTLINTGKAFISNNLNSLPMPDYSLLPMKKYLRYNIISMRGCPYNCAYCASKIISGYKVRYREPEHVIEEIKFLLDNYGHKHFWFSDDTFTSNINYNLKLLKKIKENNLKITWSCLTRVNVVNEELLSNMKETGCSYISYGIESGNQDILNKMGKKINLQEIKETIKLTHNQALNNTVFLSSVIREKIKKLFKTLLI